MHWVMIIFLFSSNGNQVTPIPFMSEELCNQAAERIVGGLSDAPTYRISSATFVQCHRVK
jgi:hypothetical protein